MCESGVSFLLKGCNITQVESWNRFLDLMQKNQTNILICKSKVSENYKSLFWPTNISKQLQKGMYFPNCSTIKRLLEHSIPKLYMDQVWETQCSRDH